MQGIYINRGEFQRGRPRSKKEIMEVMGDNPHLVWIESTSIRGDDFDGQASDLPIGAVVNFVGPDPYRDRRFYGTITRTERGFIVE